MDRKMWARTFGLAAVLLLSLGIVYVVAQGVSDRDLLSRPAQSPFVLSNLSIQPAKARPNEPVTVTVSVANTYHTWGIYSLVLQINGIREAEAQANVDAGGSQDVSFTVVRSEPGRYSVFINGLRGSFMVIASPEKPQRDVPGGAVLLSN